MPIDKDLEAALEALSRSEGKSTKELLGELLRDRIADRAGGEPAAERGRYGGAIVRAGTGDASGAYREERDEALARHAAQEFPGSPVVRYRGDHRGETAEEARERWLEEEAELLDGVHGPGGQSAGGIFGDAPIATSLHDPAAMTRSEGRVSQLANVKLLQVLDRMDRRMERLEGADDERRALPGGRPRRLRGR